MKKEEIYNAIIEVIIEETNKKLEEVSLETRLEDLGDSLDRIQIQIGVEQKFGIKEIPDEDIEKLKTVGDMVNYIKEKIQSY